MSSLWKHTPPEHKYTRQKKSLHILTYDDRDSRMREDLCSYNSALNVKKSRQIYVFYNASVSGITLGIIRNSFFTGKFDLPLTVDSNTFDAHLVPFFENVSDIAYPLFCQFTYMHQTICT